MEKEQKSNFLFFFSLFFSFIFFFSHQRFSFDSSSSTQPEISNKYPWGSEDPKPGVHGNFELFSWAPTPVGSFPLGKSEFGLYDVIGNGWEWTSSHFDCLPGFEPFVENVKNSAISNFDDHHFVLIGASFATSTKLIRRSFRFV